MKNEIKIFESPEFGRIRTVSDEKGEPWFCLTDVCKVLGLKQRHVRERLDDGVVSTDTIADSLGRLQMANFVNEDGLYDVILDSRKPSARAFRKWVTSEVLPQIRKTGGYIPLDNEDDDKTILAKAVFANVMIEMLNIPQPAYVPFEALWGVTGLQNSYSSGNAYGKNNKLKEEIKQQLR